MKNVLWCIDLDITGYQTFLFVPFPALSFRNFQICFYVYVYTIILYTMVTRKEKKISKG